MALSSAANAVGYTGTGATATYSYTFKIFVNTDLAVSVKRISTGVETDLVLTTDYTVTGVGESAGGTIVLVDSDQAWLDSSGFLSSSYTIRIRRVRPFTQTTSIRNQTDIFRGTLEDTFDKVVMLTQQLDEATDRALKLPLTEEGTASNSTLPSSTSRASKVLGFDSSGNPTAVANVPTSAVTASSYMETVLDDSTAAAARTTLVISNVVSPASLGASQNDYAGLNVDGSIVLGRLTVSAPISITGLTGGATDKLLIVVNLSASAITFTNEDAASTAANRILTSTGSSLAISQNETVTLKYDSTSSRWRVTASPLIGTAQLEDSSVTTAKIADDAVTYAKIQDITAASRILGRGSAAGAGNTEELTVGSTLSLSGTALSANAAVQADMEAQTANKVVTADVFLHAPTAAKMWCCFTTPAGTPTIQTSFNVTSITDNGTGDFTVNFTTAFSSANYAIVGMARRTGSDANLQVAGDFATAAAAGAFRIGCMTSAPAYEDPERCMVVAFGDRA